MKSVGARKPPTKTASLRFNLKIKRSRFRGKGPKWDQRFSWVQSPTPNRQRGPQTPLVLAHGVPLCESEEGSLSLRCSVATCRATVTYKCSMAEHQGASLEIESPVLHMAQSQGPGCCVPTWWAGAHATICFGQPNRR